MILRQIIFFLTIGNLSTLHLYGSEFTKTVLPTLQKKCISCHREPYKTKYGRIKKPKGKLLVIGAGKAAASMAKEFEESYNGPIEGIVITRYGHGTKTKFIEVVEASHPEPDKIGLLASKKLFH